MKTGKRFYPEIREQSVQMIFDQERECSSLCARVYWINCGQGWVLVTDLEKLGCEGRD